MTIPTVSWTTEQEQLLQRWGEECKGYHWLHTNAAKSLLFYHNLTGIASISLSGSAGTGTFLFANEGLMHTLVGLGAIIAAFAGILNKYLNLQELALKHKDSAGKYQRLANEIEYQLTLRRVERQNAGVLVKECKSIYDNLNAEAPDIPDKFLELYSKKVGNRIAKPTIANGIHTIEVRETTPKAVEKGDRPELEREGSLNNIVKLWKSKIEK